MPVSASGRSSSPSFSPLRLVAVVLTMLLFAPAAASAASVVPGRPVSTANVTTTWLQAVPQSYLGFSMNVEEMEGFTEEPAFASIINNVLNTGASGNGPFVLRLGGTYVDSSYWENDEDEVLPMYQAANAFSVYLDQTWMNSLASTVQQTGSKVILNVNAVAHSPQMAADMLGDAESTLPNGSLIAAAIGNEPDDYNLPIIPVARNKAWDRALTPANYASIFSSYAKYLSQKFPGLPLAGPESTGLTSGWTSTLLQDDANQVGLVTSHIYPLNACATPGSAEYPTLFKYLQNSLVSETTQYLQSLMQLATNRNLPYRLTELGSGTCGGLWGVNNTFVTSLWVLNQLFSFMAAGLDGVNIHLRADTPNTAIQQVTGTTSGLQAEPMLYGLAAFTDALEPNDVLTQVTGAVQPNVSVWAVYGSDGWHLVLINGTATDQLVDLNVPATGVMSLTSLDASAPWATTATFGGQTINPDGTWSGAFNQTQVQPSGGVYPVVVPSTSAVIADVAAAPGTNVTKPLKKRVVVKKAKKKPARSRAGSSNKAKTGPKKPARARS
jgi:hypothetical protein